MQQQFCTTSLISFSPQTLGKWVNDIFLLVNHGLSFSQQQQKKKQVWSLQRAVTAKNAMLPRHQRPTFLIIKIERFLRPFFSSRKRRRKTLLQSIYDPSFSLSRYVLCSLLNQGKKSIHWTHKVGRQPQCPKRRGRRTFCFP